MSGVLNTAPRGCVKPRYGVGPFLTSQLRCLNIFVTKSMTTIFPGFLDFEAHPLLNFWLFWVTLSLNFHMRNATINNYWFLLESYSWMFAKLVCWNVINPEGCFESSRPCHLTKLFQRKMKRMYPTQRVLPWTMQQVLTKRLSKDWSNFLSNIGPAG